MTVMMTIVALALAYVLGSLPGALVLGRFFGRADIRSVGSGSAGMTNAWRTGGTDYGLAVFAFDFLKGVIAVYGIAGVFVGLTGPVSPVGLAGNSAGLAFGCGALAVIGHVFPVFFGFRGGKGAATIGGVLAATIPGVLLMGVGVWIPALVISGYMSLATLLGMAGLTLACLFAPAADTAAKVFVLAMSALLLFSHRQNIQRIRAGTEPRVLGFGRSPRR